MEKSNTKNINEIRSAKEKSSRPSSMLKKIGNIPPFAHIIIIVILLLVVFLLFIFSEQKGSSPLYREALKQSEKSREMTLRHNVFGDHFVNDLYINNKNTNFYYDNITTAYVFQPQYNWFDGGACSDPYCGLGESSLNYPQIKNQAKNAEFCLSDDCLRIHNQDLYYNEQIISLPSELGGGVIKNISIYPLSSTWLVGFVYQEGGQEKGRAYRFNGSTFTDLDSANQFPFVSRSNFEGASFGFGGDDSNFLVMYGGYDFVGYQVKGNTRMNISRFIGLRVSGGGFSPIAIKQERGNETLWYICSLTDNKPRLIKLWENSSGNIKGSLALTETLLENREAADSAWCKSGTSAGELEVVIRRGGSYYKMIFQDNGFKQENNYYLITNNIFTGAGEIEAATFNNLLACDDKYCDEDVLKNSLSFSVSGNGKNYFQSNLGEKIELPDRSSGLYWQIQTPGKSTNDYSPWIDGLTSVSYSWWE